MGKNLLHEIDTAVNNFMLEVGDGKQEILRAPEFRVSGLPFCGMLAFLREDYSTEEYSKSHYTSIGTAIHTLIQTWASNNPKLARFMWGKWVCSGCGEETKEAQYHPKKPCTCDHTMTRSPKVDRSFKFFPKFWVYEEITVEWGRLTGHIDLILNIPNVGLVVIDFKTTSMTTKHNTRQWHPEKFHKPMMDSYVTQIRTYATILTLFHGMNIVGWCLVNVDRDRPLGFSVKTHSLIPSEWNEKKSRRWLKYMELYAASYDAYRKLMKWVHRGDSAESKKAVVSLVKSRPCTDKKTYHTYMRHKFYGEEKCPHRNYCIKGDKAAKSRIYEVLDDRD